MHRDFEIRVVVENTVDKAKVAEATDALAIIEQWRADHPDRATDDRDLEPVLDAVIGKPAALDFTGLTALQRTVLSLAGWTASTADSGICPQPSRASMKLLVDRGLVIERPATDGRHPPMKWWEYEVPIDVHMAWCEACDRLYTPSGKPRKAAP